MRKLLIGAAASVAISCAPLLTAPVANAMPCLEYTKGSPEWYACEQAYINSFPGAPNRSIPDQAHDNCAQGGNC